MIDKKLLEELYITQNKGQREVAKLLQIPHSNLRYYLKKYQIKKAKVNEYLDSGIKLCAHCNIEKPLTQFYKLSTETKAYASWCRDCSKEQTIARQQKYKQEAVNYKGGSCFNCGFKQYLGALEFHHLNPSEKDLEMSNFSKHPLNDVGKKELDKCVLLCANCHRMAHAGLIKL